MRLETRNPVHILLRSNTGSYSEVHERTYFIFQETKNQKSHVSERHSATSGGLRESPTRCCNTKTRWN